MRKAMRSLVGIVATLGLMLSVYPNVASADPGGNNGTIKIHDSTTGQEDRRNEPKVCNFYIAGFNFDKNSSGNWRIDRHARSGSGTVVSGTFTANENGDWRTADMTLDNGHYKAFAKQAGTPGGEKQKVFKVDCPGQQPPAEEPPKEEPPAEEPGQQQQQNVLGVESAPAGFVMGADRAGNPVLINVMTGEMIRMNAVAGFEAGPVGSVSPISELPMGVGEAAAPAVAGVQQLPATSTANAQGALAGLGVALTALGAFLLRRGRRAD